MIPAPLVRRLIRLRIKLKRNKVIILAAAVFLLAFLFSMLFMYFEKVSFFTAFYWAIITMATIGYGDITPTTYGGRIVAIIAAVAGISTFTALVSILAEYFIESSMRRMMGMHRVKYKGHYLIIGQGGSVLSCLQELKRAISEGQAEDRPIVVVLPSEEEKKRFPVEDVEVLIGDPTNKDTLQRARVEEASYVLLTLEDDSKSVFVTLMIKQMSKAKVFVEALKQESFSLLKQAGADRVILSRTLAGRLLASSIFEPEVVDVIDDLTTSTGNYDVMVMTFPEVGGLKFGEAWQRLYKQGYFLIGYVEDGIKLMPPLDSQLPQNPKVIVIKRVSSQH
ncbi:calcium-gated potassium channel protein [Thermococcus sp. M39]|uniref:potassium channel family protein n=1 Tax=unclassified Thermococcus TaxID=2627626 RepID=UPI00143870A5|nr:MULTISPECIES: ion channel [unclassified Thermococcus]NJE08394.1 calcium-gated potassium channel protein [Thermococcus sp. M39]NJE11896.1 calcium-gated potassium channel protein [Thermococcus sp. LS2]